MFNRRLQELKRMNHLYEYLLLLVSSGAVLSGLLVVMTLIGVFYKPPFYRPLFLSTCIIIILIDIPVLILQNKIRIEEWKMNFFIFGLSTLMYTSLFVIEWLRPWLIN